MACNGRPIIGLHIFGMYIAPLMWFKNLRIFSFMIMYDFWFLSCAIPDFIFPNIYIISHVLDVYQIWKLISTRVTIQ